MISGIVTYEEIIAAVKDALGLENITNLEAKIQRAIFNAENDIGPGSLLVLKSKNYVKDSGDSYDGESFTFPEDMTGEYAFADLNMITVERNKAFFKTVPGPDEITLTYIGYALDENGNLFTTRNRFQAVVQAVVNSIYRTKVFHGTGNYRLLQNMERKYDHLVLGARGNDVFPNEKTWKELAAINRGADLYSAYNMEIAQFIDPLRAGDTLVIDLVGVFNSNLD